MKHIFLKTIILSLSLLAVACKGEKQKGNFSTLDKPFVESYNNNRSDDTNTSKGKNIWEGQHCLLSFKLNDKLFMFTKLLFSCYLIGAFH